MRQRDDHGRARAGQRRCRSARRPHRRAPAGARLRDALPLLLRQPHLGDLPRRARVSAARHPIPYTLNGARLRDALPLLLRQPHLGHLPPRAASAPPARAHAGARPARRRLAEARLDASARGLAASPRHEGARQGCADVPSHKGRTHRAFWCSEGHRDAAVPGLRGPGVERARTAEPRTKYRQTSAYPPAPNAEKTTVPSTQECATPAGVSPGAPRRPGLQRRPARARLAGARLEAAERSAAGRGQRGPGARGRGGPRLPAGPGCPAGTPLS